MAYLQRYPVGRGLTLLRSILLIFVFTNQLLFSPFFPLSHAASIQSSNIHEMQSLLSQTKSSLSQVSQPIIFIHGVNQNAHEVGTRIFVPLYSALKKAFGSASLQTFFYVDDQAYADGTDSKHSCPARYAPCVSQSSVLDNAVALAQMISKFYQETQRKVALIGYSMGAAIIRTALAGCQQNVTCQTLLGASVAAMVNDVFFITGVQQGSWLAQKKNAQVTAAVATLRPLANPLSKLFLGGSLPEINSNAVKDFAPQSINIVSHNSVLPPNGIHYFNFYGDIRLSLTIGNITGEANIIQIDIGDGIVLPGTDNPQDTPFWGGARFCFQCNGHNFSQINANTSYTQWPLTTEKSIDLGNLLTCHICLLSNLFDIITHLPQFHTNIPSASSLDGTDIQVADATGLNGSPTTSIANEIALQLEAQYNVYVSSRDGNVYALNAGNGKIRWKFATGSQYISPVQVVNGVAYFIVDEDINTNPNATSTMYVLNEQDGTVIHRYNLPYFTLETGPYIPSFKVLNGNFYFSSPQMAFAINGNDGTMLWKYSWLGRGVSDPVIMNNVIYYVTGVGVIYAFKSTGGTLLWRYDLGPDAIVHAGIIGSYPAPVVINNTLYVVGWLTDNLYAINLSTHMLSWHIHLNNAQTNSLQASNNILYVGTSISPNPSIIFAVRADTGALLWSQQNIELHLANTDALYGTGVDTNGGSTGDIYALHPADGSTIWHIQMSNVYFFYMAVSQMTVYASSDTTLYALSATNGNILWQVPIFGYLTGE